VPLAESKVGLGGGRQQSFGSVILPIELGGLKLPRRPHVCRQHEREGVYTYAQTHQVNSASVEFPADFSCV